MPWVLKKSEYLSTYASWHGKCICAIRAYCISLHIYIPGRYEHLFIMGLGIWFAHYKLFHKCDYTPRQSLYQYVHIFSPTVRGEWPYSWQNLECVHCCSSKFLGYPHLWMQIWGQYGTIAFSASDSAGGCQTGCRDRGLAEQFVSPHSSEKPRDEK